MGGVGQNYLIVSYSEEFYLKHYKVMLNYVKKKQKRLLRLVSIYHFLANVLSFRPCLPRHHLLVHEA